MYNWRMIGSATVNFLLDALLIIAVIQLLFFILAAIRQTDKFTDLAYGLTFVILANYLLLKQDHSRVHLLIVLIVSIWGIRLASYLFIRINKIKQDARFDNIRTNYLRFGAFWLLQALSIWIISIPLIILLSKPPVLDLLALHWAGLIISAVGIIIESVADWQKYRFKNKLNNKNRWIDSGLWKYSRHPNYFGEILMWWGVFVYCVPNLQNGELFSIISPLYVMFLLLYVTGIPTLEKRYLQRYGNNPAYQAYVARTRLLIPLP